nr:hypothetical protein [uncultured Roseococcus sp.]
MPSTKFQLVFGPDDSAELHALVDNNLRMTQLDLRDAPFSKSMLAEPKVMEALKAWMLGAKGPSWMSWTDVEEALQVAGVDLKLMLSRYPAASSG